MLHSVTRALSVALLVALCRCETSSIRQQEGHACSIRSSDDPQLVCSPAQDLVCISTYTRMVTNPQEAPKFDGGIRHVYVCRLACTEDKDCPQAGDVCCPGDIFGKTYNKKAGCAPVSLCDSFNGVEDDGGAPDTGTAAVDAGPPADAS